MTMPPRSPLAAGFPNGPMVGADGQVTSPWRLFFVSLYTRTGTAQGVSSSSAASSIAAEADARAAAVTKLEAAIAAEAGARATAETAETKAREAADAALGQQIATAAAATPDPSILARLWFGA